MAEVKTLVDDSLLRELLTETRKIGTKVIVKQTVNTPEYVADIIDIIIIPHSDFYRTKFMQFYKLCNHNSVKALKELGNNFPFSPDFELGIGYILNTFSQNSSAVYQVKIKSEFR